MTSAPLNGWAVILSMYSNQPFKPVLKEGGIFVVGFCCLFVQFVYFYKNINV